MGDDVSLAKGGTQSRTLRSLLPKAKLISGLPDRIERLVYD
jgi:hypothetical protein